MLIKVIPDVQHGPFYAGEALTIGDVAIVSSYDSSSKLGILKKITTSTSGDIAPGKVGLVYQEHLDDETPTSASDAIASGALCSLLYKGTMRLNHFGAGITGSNDVPRFLGVDANSLLTDASAKIDASTEDIAELLDVDASGPDGNMWIEVRLLA